MMKSKHFANNRKATKVRQNRQENEIRDKSIRVIPKRLQGVLDNMDVTMGMKKFLRRRITLTREDGGNIQVATMVNDLILSKSTSLKDLILHIFQSEDDGKIPVVYGLENIYVNGIVLPI